MNKSEKLLGQWVCNVLLKHFEEHQKENTPKLFIKVSGLLEQDVEALLNYLEIKQENFNKYYEPIIRLIKANDNFVQYNLKEHETSTWLRNNTRFKQALVIIINDITPEAQSLENLFAIDEAFLLSNNGIELLYEVLASDYNFVSEEIEDLKEFIYMYSELAEPQLRNLVEFISNVVESNFDSTVKRIQNNLPTLGLFVDNHLSISSSSIKRLRRNYGLANLQDRNANTEKLQERLYTFLDSEEKNGYTNEIWELTTPEQFLEDTLNFVNKKDLALLKYNFELIEEVFNFKEKTTLTDRIKEALSYEERPKEDKTLIDQGIEAIEQNEDPDDIQDFYEEFETQLQPSPDLKKIISRRIEKLRHPSDYEDLYDALLYECFSLIDENINEENISECSFTLSVVSNQLPENIQQLITIYLYNIERVIPRISFKQEPITVDATGKSDEVTFKLEFNLKGEKISQKSFKIINLTNNYLNNLIEGVNNNKLPYIREYIEDAVEEIDVKEKVLKEIELYITSREKTIQEHFDKFNKFCIIYLEVLKSVSNNGIFSIDLIELENQLETLLGGINHSVQVTQHIYSSLNYMGSIDEVNSKIDHTGVVTSRTLTIFNPLRLISYLKRYKGIEEQLNDWINRAAEQRLHVEQQNNYLDYVTDQLAQLSPRYFSIESDDRFLIEIGETMGQGRFVLNNEIMDNTDHLSKELSDELVKVTKNYLEVYPYAKDGLDILYLYCQSADVVINSIDQLFKKVRGLTKLRLTIHSSQSANIHQKINKWIEIREEYTKPEISSKFPKVEIKVVSGVSVDKVFDQIDQHMIDADLVVLADYFGQSDQVRYTFDKINPKRSTDWFEPVYNEPLLVTEAVKRIPYVSERLPVSLQLFYKMQYMIQKHAMLDDNELYVLKNTITINNVSSALIDRIHERFNWIMIMDRFLDKSLLQKTSSKAQIIQYRSKAGKNKNYKLILSSSKYIRKLHNKLEDYGYYDRVLRKTIEILKNNSIDRNKIIETVDVVKEISGALVLKAIGPGKYAHEMLSTYLTLKAYKEDSKQNTLQVWSLCDELPWFHSKGRRPDIVITKIEQTDDKINIVFSIKELKFVNHRIFERERTDAVKQIESAETLYKSIFNFNENYSDSLYWRDELVHYLVERNAYTPGEAYILKDLQHTPIEDITVEIDTSIEVFCYTSNLLEYDFAKGENNIYEDKINGKYMNKIYPRSYILEQLGTSEVEQPDYDELNSDQEGDQQKFFEEKVNLSENENAIDEGANSDIKEEYNDSSQEEQVANISRGNIDTEDSEPRVINDRENKPGEPNTDVNLTREEQDVTSEINNINEEEKVKKDTVTSNHNSDIIYAEVAALADLDLRYNHNENQDYTNLKRQYINKLTSNFSRNKIDIEVEDVIVGPGVIRLIVRIPSTISEKKITSRRRDIQLWLAARQEPNIEIDRDRINIDIVREDPETIYFEQFMALIRDQLVDKINDKNLIAPLGLDPLSQSITIDLADSMTPHLLVGGTTGSGKSVTLNSIILGIMCLYKPENVQFVFIDPKKVEFTYYEEKIHTKEVVTDLEDAADTLDKMIIEMEYRYDLFKKEYAANINEYIEIKNEVLPRIVIVFDEFADFMNQDKELAKRVETSVLRLGQKARAAGIHLIICTQHPKADVIDTNIRNNLGARLALRTADATASNVILDQDGADRLAGKGDFLAKVAFGQVSRGKSPFLTPTVKRALLKYFEEDTSR
ncbi:FtsK/SpoIIIE domain-containing protein [Alkalihalobacterium chitinilyticum]|uniref:DNA translocase FtsK n=1 Tax=Alkalihalobacterium chitinilyticum TaxID=2980103 RepID=A0ABT5VFX8_9BACI|nr:DNA translocase FtsK [Alkalihalobacterium chitinilyticum]MDE5414180.1 DNA translocase FtsK [Alkalihalobacterium chitinilyticum]